MNDIGAEEDKSNQHQIVFLESKKIESNILW